MKRIWKYFLIIVLIVILAIGGLVVMGFSQMLDAFNDKTEDYKRNTTPLSEDVKQDICEKLNISEMDWRCQVGNPVYAAEFSPEVGSFLKSIQGEKTAFEQVQNMLGMYRYTGQVDEYQYPIVYSYDLRGDGVCRMSVWFNADGSIYDAMVKCGGGY